VGVPGRVGGLWCGWSNKGCLGGRVVWGPLFVGVLVVGGWVIHETRKKVGERSLNE